MAARENQGYLIAVIILVLLTLFLALAAFFGFSKSTEYYDLAMSNEAKYETAQKSSEANLIRAEILEAMVGNLGISSAEIQTRRDSLDRLKQQAKSDEAKKAVDDIVQRVDVIRGQFENDVKLDLKPEKEEGEVVTYSSLVADMAAVLNDKHNEVNILRNDLDRIKSDADQAIKSKDAEIKSMETRLTTKQNEFDSEKERLEKEKNELNSALDETKLANEDTNRALQTTRQEMTQKTQELNGQIASAEARVKELKEKVDLYEKETFDLPDGKIVRTGGRYVYVNLGSADGLRTNRTFSVFDQSVTKFDKGQHKASIEVTQILGPHQAEARIVESSISDPIIRGDFILTPTWDPGLKREIALVGMFDLDDDTRSDRQRLIRLIERNGGKVVAYHDDDGKITGSISSSTRYLVRGQSPKAGEAAGGVYDAIDKMFSDGKKFSVQEIDVNKLLEWMGAGGGDRGAIGRVSIERLDSDMGRQFRRRNPIEKLRGNEEDE